MLLVSGIIAMALMFAAAVAFELWHARLAAFTQARAAARNVLETLSLDLDRNLEMFDLSLRAAATAIEIPGFAAFDEEVKRTLVFGGSAKARHLGAMMITDAAGNVLLDSTSSTREPRNIAGTDFFEAHRKRDDVGLYISAPFRTPRSGELAIVLSRRILDGERNFGGIVIGTLRLSYFRALTAPINLGPDAAITLLRADGIVLARSPWSDDVIGRDLRDAETMRLSLASGPGETETVSMLDGVRRYLVMARIGDLPLILHVAISNDAIYAEWRREAEIVGGVTALATVALIVMALSLYRELRSRRGAELEAEEIAARFRVLAENASDVIMRIDLDGRRRYMSPSILDVLGYEPDEMDGEMWTDLVDPADRHIIDGVLSDLRHGVEHMTATYRCRRKNGSEIWIEARIRLIRNAGTGEPEEAIAMARDITWQRRAEEELVRLAESDPLTGIANRRRFDETLNREWRRAMRDGAPISLLMIDVDHFKAYNDRYGHPAGDETLRLIARAITANARRPGDLAARYGGEEFAVLLPASDGNVAISVAEYIRAGVGVLALPHAASPSGLVTVSIGIASLHVERGMNAAALVERADAALYKAKSNGRGGSFLLENNVADAAD
jgi:diguanylate cyclase (GGDEF)-like protein/PAS domain S-box-containing protein